MRQSLTNQLFQTKKECKSFRFTLYQRRERDSNPRYLAVQRFSRPPQSTTLPSLQNSHTRALVFKSDAKVRLFFEPASLIQYFFQKNLPAIKTIQQNSIIKKFYFVTLRHLKIIQNQPYEKDILFELPFDGGKLDCRLRTNSRSGSIQDGIEENF